MLEKKMWKPCKLREITKKQCILDSKWVFKLKEGLLYCARLTAQGFNQIPGVDFTDAYIPVVQHLYLLIFCNKIDANYFVIHVDDCIIILSTEGLMKQYKQ